MSRLPNKVNVILSKGGTFRLFTANKWYAFEKGADPVEVPVTPQVIGYIKDERFTVIAEPKEEKKRKEAVVSKVEKKQPEKEE